VQDLARGARSLEAEMVLVADTAAAAEHAASIGLIAPDAVKEVRSRSSAPA
jgi:hypothetical protein